MSVQRPMKRYISSFSMSLAYLQLSCAHFVCQEMFFHYLGLAEELLCECTRRWPDDPVPLVSYSCRQVDKRPVTVMYVGLCNPERTDTWSRSCARRNHEASDGRTFVHSIALARRRTLPRHKNIKSVPKVHTMQRRKTVLIETPKNVLPEEFLKR